MRFVRGGDVARTCWPEVARGAAAQRRHQRHRRPGRRRLLGLNRTDTRCLDIIERLDGVSAGRLASEAGLSTGAVTTVLDRLERAGYARRVPDPGDRRRVLVELTPRRAASCCASSSRRSSTGTVRQLEGYTTDAGRPRARLHARPPAPQRGAHGARPRAPALRQEGEAAS